MRNFSGHGNVMIGASAPFISHRRYIALMDVLGMKSWLFRDHAKIIAESLDCALIASDQSSCGNVKGVSYGPLIGVIHFSDTLLAWSPDDSWASLSALMNAIKMIVGISLTQGVPLRGSISLGEAVCNKKKSRFVGLPIVDAYTWAEKSRDVRRYHSVGVDFTPSTITEVQKNLSANPPEEYWNFESSVFNGEKEITDLFMWHEKCLFVNHWAHGMFLGKNPEELFLSRNLPGSNEGDIKEKANQVRAFFDDYQGKSRKSNIWNEKRNTTENFQRQLEKYVELDLLRKQMDLE